MEVLCCGPSGTMTQGKAPQTESGPFKVSLGVGISVLLLTLAVWIFFYVEQMPLDPGSTTVVALGAALSVVLVRWLWSWRRPRVEAKAEKSK